MNAPETNIVLVTLEHPSLDPDRVQRALAERGVRVITFGPRRLRAITHLDVDDAGIERAVEVFRRIRGSLPDAVLIVAGTGPLKGILDKAAKELGPTRIRLLNDVPRAELPSLYSAADGLLLTSDIEQFPTVMLESLACGTPVFSTDVGDVSLVLSEPSMGLVCPANPESFAERVAEYLPEERRLRASRAPLRRQATRKYDWDAIGPQIEAVLHEASG